MNVETQILEASWVRGSDWNLASLISKTETVEFNLTTLAEVIIYISHERFAQTSRKLAKKYWPILHVLSWYLSKYLHSTCGQDDEGQKTTDVQLTFST